jgi:hypothetical protein
MPEFSAIEFLKQLTKAGVEPKLAEAIAGAQAKMVGDLVARDLVTREDMNDLRILVESRLAEISAGSDRTVLEIRRDIDAARAEIELKAREIKAAHEALQEHIKKQAQQQNSTSAAIAAFGESQSGNFAELQKSQSAALTQLKETVVGENARVVRYLAGVAGLIALAIGLIVAGRLLH